MPRSRQKTPDAAQLAAAVVTETRDGLREHENRCSRFDKAYEIWRGRESKPTARKPWEARMRVKYGMQVLDQTMVNVVQGAPKAICAPRRRQDVAAAKAMETVLGYYADQDHLAQKEPIVVQQALVYGVSPVKNHWLYRESDVPIGWDPELGEWNPRMVKVVEADRPTMEPWDVYHCWWDPYAPTPDAAAYLVLRSYMSKDELERRAYNPDTRVGMYRNLDLLFSSGTANLPQPTAQNQIMNSDPVPVYGGRFEIWEVWRDNRLTVLGNRQVLLYDGPKPYWMPGKPVAIGHSRPDFHRIEGISETELVDDLQQGLWTHENLVMENLKMTVMRGATVRETVPDMAALVLRPHYLWPVTDHDDVHFQDPPPLPREAYEQRQTMLGALQYVTGINPYVTGASVNQGADQTTATGVSVLSNAAGKLLEFKARLIAQQVFLRTYEQWADLTRQFLTREVEILIDPDSPDLDKRYGPADVYGDYDIRVQAGSESLNRQQRRAEAIALLTALAPYIQFGLNVKVLAKRVGDAYDLPAEELFTAPQPQQLPPGAPYPAALPPGQLTFNGGIAPQPPAAVISGNAR